MALSVNNFQHGGFMRFDVVSDHSDHRYSDTEKGGGGGSFARATSAVYKKIMREWKILSEHLPDSIYVRVYDTRIDLLRAVIVGAAGTPYHDGLFFFDIKFPRNYPDEPPKVHYHTRSRVEPQPKLAPRRHRLSELAQHLGRESKGDVGPISVDYPPSPCVHTRTGSQWKAFL